jgi:hypothetical protein
MIIVTDILKSPFDEGAKNAAFNLIENLRKPTGQIPLKPCEIYDQAQPNDTWQFPSISA